MANSKRETIVEAAETAMKGITVSGGYNNTVNASGVGIWRTEESQDQEYPYVWIKDGPEQFTPFGLGGNGKGRVQAAMKLEILGAVQLAAGTGTKAVAAQARTFLADFFKAINGACASGNSFGVTDCRVDVKSTDIQVEQGKKLIGLAYLELEVFYQINRFDYTA
jgi:hypothetical protein